MVQVIRNKDRFSFKNSWLHATWHFSFGHYYDPENMGFGALRVFNDDWVEGGGGFPMHPHEEMEIVTYVLSGALEHKDSTGGHGILRAGDFQRMSAGTGVRHSEFNASPKERAHLLQIWVEPGQAGLKPGYEQKHVEVPTGKLAVVASPAPAAGALTVHQDALFLVGKFNAGDAAERGLAGRRGYVFVIEGSVDVNGQRLEAGDQARLTGESGLRLQAAGAAHVLVIDLA